MTLVDLANDIIARGEISAADIFALRQRIYGDATVSPDEAEALFRLDESTQRRVAEWRVLFVEALTDWLVRQQEPAGYITDAQADWLIERIEADRRVRDGTELELVVRALELADAAPASLAAFGLKLVTRSVVENDGVIDAQEIARLRRLVFAPSGPGRLAVSREEAEALFELNDATRGRANDPAWTDFFMRAVGNAVTAAAGWVPPDREEALRRQRWLADPGDGLGEAMDRRYGEGALHRSGFLARLVRDGFAALGKPSVFQERLAAQERAASTAAPVDAAEARWLVERIGRDGVFDENERALIAFLRELAPSTDAALQPLIEQMAA